MGPFLISSSSPAFTSTVLLLSNVRPTAIGDGGSHLGLHDVWVDFSHAVHSVGSHNAEMGHVDPFASFLFYQRHPSQTVDIFRKQGSNFLGKGRERP